MGPAAAVELELAQSTGDVRVGVHDVSRLEWSVSLAVPARGRAVYSIDFEIEIPSHLFPQHAPWERLQQFARLDQRDPPPDAGTMDGLRRQVVGLAARLTRVSEGFARHVRLATSPHAPHGVDPIPGLELWLEAAARMVDDARERLATVQDGDADEMKRERQLVDEYASTRILEFFAGASHALERDLERPPPFDVGVVEERLAVALDRELGLRRAKGFVDASGGSAAALEQYIERASLLKKHFQEVLFLDAERYSLVDRIHHVVAALVAILASTWAFMWQIMLTNRSTGTTVGSGVVALALVAGLVYAAKDRIKEVGRAWVAGEVHKHWAQRVVRFRTPPGRLATRDVLVAARESFHQTEVERPDGLNPESGAKTRVTIVQYVQRGEIKPSATLFAESARVKQVFRYDLSPLFARLDDATKQVPVVDSQTHRVRFADAARCYRLPIELTLTHDGERLVQKGVLVVDKRGLERVERHSLPP